VDSAVDRLPIYEIESELVARFEAVRRLIIQAPTGSGKSTQVPQMLLDHGLAGNGQIAILQPRRLAARLLAARVAQERGVALGEEVGYQVRFEQCTGPKTRIKYVTEGILLRQMIQEPLLSGTSILIFDEFHERHLYGDLTLAQALDLQETARGDLGIIVMSATLDAGLLEGYLRPCAVLRSEGRMFPVEIEFAAHRSGAQSAPVWERAAEAFEEHVRRGERGDVLIFMPGSYEIQQTLGMLRQLRAADDHVLLPLHGELAPGEQDAAVARQARPKVVVSTNVAETSVTIDGVRLVIDSGQARIPRHDPHRGINTLWVEKISQASADQRAGRAGRTAPGRCVRLWTAQEHDERPPQEAPEIRRLDLAEAVLTLKAAGVEDLRRFRWLEPPMTAGLAGAEELLEDLGALDHEGRITELGRRMLAFPVHPRYARMLVAAEKHGCVYQAALISALTQGRDLLIRNPGKAVESLREDLFGHAAASDFWILMRAWSYAAKNDYRVEACRRVGVHAQTARQVRPILDSFLRIAARQGLDTRPGRVSDVELQKCVLSGFSDRVARRVDAGTLRCELVHGRRGLLARESVVQESELLVAAEIREIEGGDGTVSTRLSLATGIAAEWLRELYPEDFKNARRVFYDSSAKRVYAEEEVEFRGLRLSARRVEPPPADEASRILSEEIVAGRLTLKRWDHGVEQWIVRLNLLSAACPELGLPAVDEEARRHLVEQICAGAVSYKEIKEREVKPVVESWLSAEQRLLVAEQMPERVTLTNGRSCKVTYAVDGPPFVAARIQELYGVTKTPRLAMGRHSVVVHVLAPSMRPVQITKDLEGFWREHYPRVKQELQRKYPKHEWR
jgi:ATP-dependent helicase HrpB